MAIYMIGYDLHSSEGENYDTLPRRLTALMRRLNADHDERQERGPGYGTSTTETSSRIDRRGRC
jgi:hypothetical protein